jgi:serine protease
VSRDNDGEPGRDADPADPGDAVAADECGVGEPAEDSSWHGLSVTGVILAESDNTVDIAGIDFAAQLLPIRVLGKCGGSLADVAEAIRWAAGLSVSGVPMNPNPARVINLSLSGSGACSPAEQSAINAAVAAGAVVVTAAGNESGSVADVSPANCANVIVVGAIARDGSIASYVNTGSQVDLAAPGGEVSDGIVTLSNLGITMRAGDARGVITGTSFSTAQVSGVASLMLAANASLTPALVEEVLKATTRTFPDASCNDTLCGTGVLNADAALAGAADPSSVISQSVITSGGGGGGCVMRAGAAAGFDPLWLIGLILVALSRYRLIRRSR